MKNEILKKLIELSDLVNNTIERVESDLDINSNLRKIAINQMEICRLNFEKACRSLSLGHEKEEDI